MILLIVTIIVIPIFVFVRQKRTWTCWRTRCSGGRAVARRRTRRRPPSRHPAIPPQRHPTATTTPVARYASDEHRRRLRNKNCANRSVLTIEHYISSRYAVSGHSARARRGAVAGRLRRDRFLFRILQNF